MVQTSRRHYEPRHIRLYASTTNSKAWHHLSGNAVKVLLALVARDNGTRNGKIGFSCREAARSTGLTERTAWRCLRELEELGFIACTEKGGFSRKTMHSSLWRYTWQAWPEGKMGPTREFEKWRCKEIGACKICNPTVEKSDEWKGIGPLSVEKYAAAEEKMHGNEDSFQNADSTTLIVGHRDPRRSTVSSGWKEAKDFDLDNLRLRLNCHLAKSEIGEQGSLARELDIPPGTLSKFRHGRGLPERYRSKLAHALASAR